MPEPPPGVPWQRVTGVMIAASFVAFIGFSFVTPFMPLYFHELGVRDEAAVALWSGVALASGPLVAAFTAPVWGLVADRYGPRRLLAMTLVGYTLLLAAQAWAFEPWHLVAGRSIMGLFGGFTALALGIVALAAPRERVTFAVGLVQASQVLGTAMGPAFGGFVAEHAGIRGSFLVSAALIGTVAGATVWLLPNVRGSTAERRGAPAPRGVGALAGMLRVPGFAAMLGVLLVARGVERTFDPILPLYVGRLQEGNVATTTGFIATAGTLATAAASAGVDRLARRWSAQWLLALALLGGALASVPLAFVTSTQELLILRIVWGVLAGGIMTLAFAVGGVLLPPERRATAFGLLGSATYYGGAGGALFAGAIAAHDLRAVFIYDAALYLAAALMLVGAPLRRAVVRFARRAPSHEKP